MSNPKNYRPGNLCNARVLGEAIGEVRKCKRKRKASHGRYCYQHKDYKTSNNWGV